MPHVLSWGWALRGAVDEQIGCKACTMTNDIESEIESTLSCGQERIRQCMT